MNYVFLIYDSRSGSTLLSREISAYFNGVLVTPELRFDTLLRRGEAWMQRCGPDQVGAELERLRFADKTGLASTELEAAAAAGASRRLGGLIEELTLRLAARSGQAPPTTVVIKSGVHLRVWREIRAALPDAKFLFIVRDPRAVIQSKLTTERPYHAGQSMAWAGCAAAAFQWRWYAATARRIAAQGCLLEVRYESLVAEPAVVMEQLGAFIGVSSEGRGDSTYRIPQAEQAIHQRVLAGGLAVERIDAWRGQLGAREQVAIEQICGTEMLRRGYARAATESLPDRLATTSLELLRSAWLFGTGMLARATRRLRPGDAR